MTKISHISWGGYDKGFYGIFVRNWTLIYILHSNNEDVSFHQNYIQVLELVLSILHQLLPHE